MGFLDHSTSNIIVDAVLTNLGRQFLARNDGSFSIVKFSLADDEIDYSMITKYGRVVGKEKIEKNTPVFEAQTATRVALKYRLVSNSNPNIIRVPKLALTSDGLDDSGTVLTMSTNSSTATRSLTISQALIGDSLVDPEFRDQQFNLRVPNLFLQVVGAAPDFIDESGVASYTITRSPSTTAVGGSQATFTLAAKNISATVANIYSPEPTDTGGTGTVKVPITISGLQSSAVYQLDVEIQTSTI